MGSEMCIRDRASAEDDEEDLKAILQEYDMIFISAGMGGGTGTGAAPVIARIAKELDKLVVAVVTTPFKFEGGKRARAAKDGIEQLGNYVDSIVTVPNEKVQSVYRNLTVIEAFKKADDVLLSGVDGLVRAIRSVGTINLDFNDVRTLMKETKGHAMMGIGRASGDDRARQATEKAIRSPLTDNLRLENAKGLLVSMKGVLTMEDPAEVAAIVEDLVNIDEADIFYGIVIDETMGDDFEVTVIATGLTLDDRPKVAPAVKAPTQQATAQPQVAPTAPQPRVSTPKKQMDVGDYLRNRMATD